jgi:hypothetical protein
MAAWKDIRCLKQSRRAPYPRTKVLSSTWAMKKKSNRTFHARVTARGYEQVNGIHYDEDTKASPVVNKAMILITYVLMFPASQHNSNIRTGVHSALSIKCMLQRCPTQTSSLCPPLSSRVSSCVGDKSSLLPTGKLQQLVCCQNQ